MIKLANDDFLTSDLTDISLAEGYAHAFCLPDEENIKVIFDENVLGLASANGVSEIFPGIELIRTDNLAFAGATDSQISDLLIHEGGKIIFITADRGDSFPPPSERLSLVRFTNKSVSTDGQLSLLWRLSRTKGFRNIKTWFNKEIRLGTDTVLCNFSGNQSSPRALFLPHPHSPKRKQWVKTKPIKKF